MVRYIYDVVELFAYGQKQRNIRSLDCISVFKQYMCISSKNAENIAHIYKKSFLSGIIRQCIEEYLSKVF